mmetsp:Transcript_23690/g.27270  ORF Transcript_23690/g.27270 Transcript_23690/m.27270 type:complete len:113 (+) Transcript_23690:812-1150(+)
MKAANRKIKTSGVRYIMKFREKRSTSLSTNVLSQVLMAEQTNSCGEDIKYNTDVLICSKRMCTSGDNKIIVKIAVTNETKKSRDQNGLSCIENNGVDPDDTLSDILVAVGIK